jgi:hypothetical protein
LLASTNTNAMNSNHHNHMLKMIKKS